PSTVRPSGRKSSPSSKQERSDSPFCPTEPENHVQLTEGRAKKLKPLVNEPLWIDVCSVDDIIPGTGVAAMLFGVQVAIVRPRRGAEVYALSNFDPFSRAFVMARGIVGDRAG